MLTDPITVFGRLRRCLALRATDADNESVACTDLIGGFDAGASCTLPPTTALV
jgi:hypothetical protein